MQMESDLTPLQKKLETIANEIGKLGVYVACMTFIAMTVRTLIAYFKDEDRNLQDGQEAAAQLLDKILEAFIIGVTVIVVAVPEGLPLAVSISLAFSSSQMYKEHNLVRKLHAAETMGGASDICTDKTGTLTAGKMEWLGVYTNGELTHGHKFDLSTLQYNHILQQAIVLTAGANAEKEGGEIKVVGNTTDKGIMEFLLHNGADLLAWEDYKSNAFKKEDKVLEIPFKSEFKMSATVVKGL